MVLRHPASSDGTPTAGCSSPRSGASGGAVHGAPGANALGGDARPTGPLTATAWVADTERAWALERRCRGSVDPPPIGERGIRPGWRSPAHVWRSSPGSATGPPTALARPRRVPRRASLAAAVIGLTAAGMRTRLVEQPGRIRTAAQSRWLPRTGRSTPAGFPYP